MLLSALSAAAGRASTLLRVTPRTDLRARTADGLGLAEVHAHTLASDGMVTASELVGAAGAIGLSVLCVTDHDTLSDIGAAAELGASLGVEVVRGEEVTASFPPGIHIVGLFLEHQVRMHMSVADTIDAIHDAGGLAVIAHPFMPTWFASMTAGRARQLLETHRVDGIEVRHTAPVLPGAWGQLDTFYAAHKDRLGAALGAGDSHFGEHDLGRVLTVFPGRTLGRPSPGHRGADDIAALGLGGAERAAHEDAARPAVPVDGVACRRAAGGRVGTGTGPAGR